MHFLRNMRTFCAKIRFMDWTNLQHLLALSREETLPAAAEALGVNRTTVARRIERLEEQLGVRLVEKVGRDLTLTAAGREAVAAAETIEGEFHHLERQVFGRDQKLAGVIRLTLTQGIAILLAPYLADFHDEHPDLMLELSVTNSPESLELMEADVALRMTTQPPLGLVGKKIARPMTALYASRELAASTDTFGDVDRIRNTIFDRNSEASGGVRTNSVDLTLEMIALGKGVSHIPCYMGELDPRVTRISEPTNDVLPEIWLLYHPRSRAQIRIRRFVDHLIAAFEELRPRIEGTQPAGL